MYHLQQGMITDHSDLLAHYSQWILVDGQYYVYYTKRDTIVPPIGASRASESTDEIPSTDWDLCEIWYATSEDGFRNQMAPFL